MPSVNEETMNICHIDTGKSWRGGQQQAFYLHRYLCENKYKSIMICKKNSAMAQKCQSDNLPHKCLPLANEIDIYSAFQIARLHSDILHLHDAHALSIGLLAKLFFRRQKLIATRRVDFPLKNFFSSLKYKNKMLDKIVCVSQNVYNTLLSDGIPEKKLRLIHSGIDTQRYAVGNANLGVDLYTVHNIPRDHLIIGTIAAFAGHKDYPTLLRAAHIVGTAFMPSETVGTAFMPSETVGTAFMPSETVGAGFQPARHHSFPKITFIALGDGPEKQSIEKLHSDLELGNSFILAGFKENVADYLHWFDIFVLSSKMEGLGTAVLDAMSARKAIVACASGGIPEMIQHEHNGLLAEKENPADLAEKILRLASDEGLRESLARQAEIDVQKFSIQQTTEKNITLYCEIYRL